MCDRSRFWVLIAQAQHSSRQKKTFDNFIENKWCRLIANAYNHNNCPRYKALKLHIFSMHVDVTFFLTNLNNKASQRSGEKGRENNFSFFLLFQNIISRSLVRDVIFIRCLKISSGKWNLNTIVVCENTRQTCGTHMACTRYKVKWISHIFNKYFAWWYAGSVRNLHLYSVWTCSSSRWFYDVNWNS